MTDNHPDEPLTAATPAAMEPADRVAAVVQAVPGVAALHAGMFGEVGTYLPGRKIPGVRLSDTGADIHVSVFFDAAVRDVAAQIRSAVHSAIGGPVDVTVEDVLPRPRRSIVAPDADHRRVR